MTKAGRPPHTPEQAEARRGRLIKLYRQTQKRMDKGESLQAIADSLGMTYAALVSARSRARSMMVVEAGK